MLSSIKCQKFESSQITTSHLSKNPTQVFGLQWLKKEKEQILMHEKLRTHYVFFFDHWSESLLSELLPPKIFCGSPMDLLSNPLSTTINQSMLHNTACNIYSSSNEN